MNIRTITCSKGIGKTTFLKKFTDHYIDDGWSVGGFYQRPDIDENNQLVRYDAVHIPTSESVLLASMNKEGVYKYHSSGFYTTSKWLLEDAKQCKILCLDEFGKDECMHRDHHQAFFQ